ncbi:MAG: nucleoside phosphorylase [Desulfobacterales bacterium]|nr:nucleoside phosphorylase [Desulfobacterales bacterium]
MGVKNNDAIINPIKSKNSPDIGSVAVMTSTRPDLFFLCDLFNYAKDDYYRLFTSRLYFDRSQPDGFSLTGPVVGAPYAVMLLETLIAWGARKIIYLGWCGAVAETVKIGDIILPTTAVIDEGTSAHYKAADNGHSAASSSMITTIRHALDQDHVVFHSGAVWSTDAVFRETRQRVETHQKKGVLAVEMEVSALYTVAQFRQVELGAILVVSDELSSLIWRPGFRQKRFVQSRQTACKVVKTICQESIPK